MLSVSHTVCCRRPRAPGYSFQITKICKITSLISTVLINALISNSSAFLSDFQLKIHFRCHVKIFFFFLIIAAQPNGRGRLYTGYRGCDPNASTGGLTETARQDDQP